MTRHILSLTEEKDLFVGEKLSYRPEIDGLRAIAVISVILYHAQLNLFGTVWFEGGFIGVDVFFVISGYLITRIVLSELRATGTVNLKYFYERRARRILPMLFVVIFVSVPFAWQKLLPPDFVDYAESVLASIFFGSNFYFYFTTTEYGANDALLDPFLHTWSLGVEEQFYVVFPILAILLFKLSRSHFFAVLLGLSLSSLFFAIFMGALDSNLNFYLPFSRFWELAVGSMLAYKTPPTPSLKKHRTGAHILPMLGLFMIAYSILEFNGETAHPGLLTAIPVAGVALIIRFASSEDPVGRILASKPLVWIGLVSYSAYLWHYPVFAFLRLGGEATNLDKLQWILIVAVLSVSTFFIVEKPFRDAKWISGAKFFATIACCFVLTTAFAYFSIMNNGFSRNLPPILSKTDLSAKNWTKYKKQGELCHGRTENFCSEFIGPEKPTVFFIGDSHFSAISQSVRSKMGKTANYMEANFNGCPFAIGIQRRFENNALDSECTPDYQMNRYNAIPDENSVIVVGGRMPVYLSSRYFDNKEGGVEDGARVFRKFESEDGSSLVSKFRETWMQLLEEGHSLVLIYPIPAVGWDVPQKLFEVSWKYRSIEKMSAAIISNPLTTDYNVYLERSKETFELYDSLHHPNVFRVYPHELFCNRDVTMRCVTHDAENVFYSDDDHPSSVGADMIAPLVVDQIRKAVDALEKH